MISIAMITYNGEKYLREQLDSILNQTYSDFELIICDDCSKDMTVSILQEYTRKDSRIKLYINEENLGFKKNFEKAILLCNGEYIALSDQDDIWINNKLELCVQNINDYDLLCTNSEIINSENIFQNYTMKNVLKIKKIPNNQFKIFSHLVFTNFVQGSTILAKKDFILSALPIPNNFEYHDYWFGLLASLSKGVKYLDIPTLKYRKHENQVTTNTNELFIKEITHKTLKANLIVHCNKHLNDLDIIKKNIKLNPKQSKVIYNTAKYYEHMKDKDLYTLMYFIKNYDIIFFDKNIIKKIIRIIKRILGLIIYKMGKKKWK